MGIEAKCGGLAVAAGAAVRRPLQPRDTNVAASTVVVGKAAAAAAAPKPKPHPKAAGTRPALPSSPPPPPAPLSPVASQCGRVSVAAAGVGVAEVSLAEELEKARERRARLRAVRERTEREMESRAEVMERAAAEWDRRAEDQRRLVSELMRLIGMPEVYTPVESLRSKEERKRRGAIVAHSGSTGSISIASTLQVDDGGAEACSDQESEVTGGRDNRDGKKN